MMTEEAALKVHFDAKILIYSVAQNRKVVHRKPVECWKIWRTSQAKSGKETCFRQFIRRKGGKREREGRFL